MVVKLVGFNVDAELLEKIKVGNLREEEKKALTPETISAAFARISRDPRDIAKLREEAKRELIKARNTNASIYYDMGHHSIAEHCIFNFEITDVSRLSIEDLEETRLGIVETEKSQRYQKLTNDFVIPEELNGREKEIFIETINFQNQTYHKIFPLLINHLKEKFPTLTEKEIENKAKEDARYVTSLAMKGQLGMTINARSLEHKIRKFMQDPKKEVRDIGGAFYVEASKIAPSLIILATENGFYEYWKKRAEQIEEKNPEEAARLRNLKYENEHFENTKENLKNLVFRVIENVNIDKNRVHKPFSLDNVKILDYTPEPELKIAAAIIHQNSTENYQSSLKYAKKLRNEDKLAKFLLDSSKHIQQHDSLLEAFEVIDFTYELTISASCFAQLKRHRILTLLKQNYNHEIGIVVPDSIKEAGLESEIRKVEEKTNKTYNLLKQKYGKEIAEYSTMQAQQRKVYLKLNARELGAFCRLRCDSHAQWDIRKKAKIMAGLAEQVTPIISWMFCGKDNFNNIRKQIYS
jgi:thymidylate synthase ThyX